MITNINYIQVTFSLLTSGTILMGSLINTFENYLPVPLSQTFRYGKFAADQKRKFISYFEVPKSSFKQFYKLATIISTLCLGLVYHVYVCNEEVPTWILNFLDTFCGKGRMTTTSPMGVLLAVILLTLQCYRRLYDTHFVSVFSKNGRINLVHFLIGMTYYPGCFIAILCEAPKFTDTDDTDTDAMERGAVSLQFSDITNIDLWAVGLFMWAWWHQHVVTVILANLRKNSKGEVVTEEHKMPQGDWFDYLSSPHQVAEILMYIALTVILRFNITWMFIVGFVLSNQVETCFLSHWWYKEKFLNFPKSRKAIIPFVY